MKRTAGIVSWAVALMLAVPGAVAAQDGITLDAQETLRFDNAGANVAAQWDNVYIGPYQGTLLSDPTQPTITLYCVDFAHSVGYGQVWDVNVSGLTSGDLSTTRLGQDAAPYATDLLKYQKAAYLASLFDSAWQTYETDRRTAWSGIHAAIWSIMTNGFPSTTLGVNNPTLATSLAAAWIARADAAAAGGFVGMNFAEWAVLTDVSVMRDPASGTQEFLVRTGVVPEPQTYLLMASGLLLIAVFARRRLREFGEA